MSQPDMTGSFAAAPTPKPRESHAPKLRKAGMLATTGLAIAAGAAAWQGYSYLHNAPGQAAMESLMPRETLGAISLDLKPRSWEQVQVMRRIGSSLQNEGLETQIRDGWEKSFKDAPLLREVRPYLEQSGAMAAWPGATAKASDYRFAIIVSVSSPEQVEALVTKLAKQTDSWNSTKIAAVSSSSESSATPDTYVAVVGRYVVFSPTRDAVTNVIDVSQGKHDSLLQAPEYTALRSTVPGDANILSYVSPSAPRSLREQSGVLGFPTDATSTASLKSFQGGIYTASLRDNGIYFDSTTQATGAQFDALRNMARLDTKTSLRVPKGAIGIMAMAQPGAYYDAMEVALRDAPQEAHTQWDQAKQKFEKETGLSIEKDVRPAFNGDAVFALYPGQGDLPVNGVALLTDARGAQPAALLQQTQGYIKREEKSLDFVSQQDGAATYWSIPKAAADKNGGNTLATLRDNSTGNVTLYAQVGQTALAGSSHALLESAVKSYETGETFTTTAPLPQDAQFLMVIRPQAAIEALTAKSPTALSDAPFTKDDLMKLWGTSDIMASGSYTGNTMKGTAFLPLQYEEVTKLIARVVREGKMNRAKVPSVMEAE